MGTTTMTDMDETVQVSTATVEHPIAVDLASDGIVRKGGKIVGFHIPEDEAWRLIPEFARDRDFPFFRSTTEYVIDCVKKYAAVKRDLEADYDKSEVWRKIANDLHDSELLQRLLSGHEVKIIAPPKSFKSHWYELLDNSEAIPEKVRWTKWTSSTGTGGAVVKKDDDEYVLIDEHQWKIEEVIVEEKDEPVVVVSYNSLAPRYMLRRATDEEKDRLLHRRKRNIGSDLNEFILIRLEEDDGTGNDADDAGA